MNPCLCFQFLVKVLFLVYGITYEHRGTLSDEGTKKQLATVARKKYKELLTDRADALAIKVGLVRRKLLLD